MHECSCRNTPLAKTHYWVNKKDSTRVDDYLTPNADAHITIFNFVRILQPAA